MNPGPQVNKLRPYQCNAPTNLLVSGIYVFIHMYTVLIRRKKRRPRSKEDSNHGHMDEGVAPYRCAMPLFEMEWEIKSI